MDKVFFDILSDYQDLKYIFEYGFGWDDKATQEIMNKGSRSVRELDGILSVIKSGNMAYVPWYQYTDGGKKSNRLLVWKNHYQLVQDNWIQELYSCYGMDNMPYERNTVQNCPQKPYSYCRDKESRCDNSKICSIMEKKDWFYVLCNVKEYEGEDDFSGEYRDILTKRKNSDKWHLRGNRWTFEKMKTDGIFTQRTEYENFQNMILFLSRYAPMSVLGGFFLLRTKEPLRELTVLVRNLPQSFGLEQEYIHRCLYAMDHKKYIEAGKKRYIPYRIKYRDKGMFGIEKHLYLEGVEEQAPDKIVEIPLYDGNYIQVGAKIFNNDKENIERYIEKAETGEDEGQLFKVEFYYNQDTAYLRERRERGWKAESEEPVSKRVFFESPYYSGQKQWKTDLFTYRIRKRDIPGFKMFIESFGDFAGLQGEWPTSEIKYQISTEKEKAKNSDEQSLMNVYTSRELLLGEKLKKKPLPPRNTELQWLRFVLGKYPNVCRIFLSEEKIEQLEERVAEELKDRKAEKSVWFDAGFFDYSTRVRDISKNSVEKYRKIFDAVYQKDVLVYEYKDKVVDIFPYALEYDVLRHLTLKDSVRKPIDIMGYDLRQKRNVRILYKDIRVNKRKQCQEIRFSMLDKLYHVLAYAIRCAEYGKDQMWDGRENRKSYNNNRFMELMELLWPADKRGGDSYTRNVKKKYPRFQEETTSSKEYKKMIELIRKDQDDEAEEFIRNVFSYWVGEGVQRKVLSEYQQRYYGFLLKCFSGGYVRLKSSKVKDELQRSLDSISNEDVWDLLSGDERDGVENEIAFYNERIKNAEVSFSLKGEKIGELDKVYEAFGSFICVGRFVSNEEMRFTVSYEEFYYRKIHMALMALQDIIEDIEPEETADIIKYRMENRRKIHG